MQTIHINLISDQITPNLIPSFADPNCSGAILVFGDSTLDTKGDRLEEIYQQRGIPVVWRSHGKSSHHLPTLKQQAQDLLNYLTEHHIDKRWVLNATCGTKPMSLAMTLAFYQHNANLPQDGEQALILYTDSQNKAIPILNENIDFQLPYKSVLTLEELLAANGFWVTDSTDQENDSIVHDRAELTLFLGQQFAGPCQNMLGSLQAMASTAAKDFPTNQQQQMRQIPRGPFVQVYTKLAQAGLINWQEESKQIQFCSEDACRYLAGLWLEELTYLQALQCGFEQVAMSVEGVWGTKMDQHRALMQGRSDKGKNNEFDLLIRHKNQLLIIECKARFWGADVKQQGVSNDQDTLHKLDTLGNKLGGLYARNLLISAYEVNTSMVNRAKVNRIQVCDRVNANKIKQCLYELKQAMD
jgi:hypothetical protein